VNNISSDGEAKISKKFIATILQQSNLLAQLVEIFYSVEQELRQQYSEDQLTDRGQIYVVYRAIESGYFSNELEIGLNEKQKKYLLKLAKLNQLELSIVRRDCLIYDVTIQLEIKNLIFASGPDKFLFNLNIIADLSGSEVHEIKGSYSNIGQNEFHQFVEAYCH
jgi:hypothetical protein